MKMGNPLVSVILPTYNWKKEWLSEAIESVLYQTYENFEFIIINDASTNDIEKTILAYKEKDKRIIYVKNIENLKLTKTLNKWICISKWEYIARIDDDDIWRSKDKLKKQIDFMEKNKDYWLCGTWLIIINELGKDIKEVHVRQWNNEIRKNLLMDSQFAHASILLRKNILEKTWLYNPERNFVEDYELRLRVGIFSKLYNITEPLISYRINSSWISQKNRKKQKKMSIALTKKYWKHYPNAFLSRSVKLISYPLSDKIIDKILYIYKHK